MKYETTCTVLHNRPLHIAANILHIAANIRQTGIIIEQQIHAY